MTAMSAEPLNALEGQATDFNRPPRQQIPTFVPEDIDIPPPPADIPPPMQNWLISIVPVLGIGVMAVFYVWRAVAVPNSSGLFVIPLLILAMFTIGGTVLAQRWRQREYAKRELTANRDYIRLLEKKRARLQAAHNAQIAILETTFFNPRDSLSIALARDHRLWERRPGDADFAACRLGVGAIPSVVKINAPDPDSNSPELNRALNLVNAYRALQNAPVAVSLQQDCSLGLVGRRDQVVKLARSMVAHLALTHAPTDLRIHLIAPQANYDDWRWLEWLPHVRRGRGRKSSYLAFDSDSIRALLGGLSQQIDTRRQDSNLPRLPHLLLIIDGPHLADSEAVFATILRSGNQVGASALCLVNNYENVPSQCAGVVQLEQNGAFAFTRTNGADMEISGTQVDQLASVDAEYSARALASVMLREVGGGGRIPRQVNFLDLYGIRTVDELYPQLRERWGRTIPDGELPFPVPIGRESLAVDTYLLLDEEHHGPHGVLAGTTGSGKSELLQTLVCALAIEHDPRLVNFLLIDFKGGSTFNVFADLPHTVGMLTNLDGLLVERTLEALKAETRHRQQFFKQINVRDITQYHRFHARGAAHLRDETYQPLPHLFVIVDEFAQLGREMPDFLHELVRTAQVGRSLGLHLILGTQSPMDVITDEMNANLQFRICLRVQNIEASRAMLRRPDAAYLPAGWAGRGYLQVGERSVYKQFQTAFAGGDYRDDDVEDVAVLELVTGAGEVVNLLPVEYRRAEAETPGDEPFTTAAAIVHTVADYASKKDIAPMPPLLLPPMPLRMALDQPFASTQAGGWDGDSWQPAGWDHMSRPIQPGSAPVGLIDDVYNRQQTPLWIHLNAAGGESGQGGHVLVIGGPGTGKTTFMQSLALSQALLHPPDQLHLYFLSFKGSELHLLGDLPHAEQVITGAESERVRRLFRRLLSLLEGRQPGGVNHPIIVLFIDQYEQFRDTYFNEHVADFERLVSEGYAAGIYVVVGANSLSAIPERLRALMPQRVALQLNNVADYLLAVGDLNKTPSGPLPKGRGFIAASPPLMCQISLPTLQSPDDDESVQAAMIELVDSLRQSHLRAGGNQTPPPIRELPDEIPLDSLPLPKSSHHLVTTIGRRDDDALSPFELDWDADGHHFIVTGSAGSGKTNLLHVAILAAAQQYSPEQLRFLLLDFTGRSLFALEGLNHVIACVTDSLDLQTHFAFLQAEMDDFQRRWREGETAIPRTVVVIDDYEIAADVLSMNLDLMRQLRDHVHLHGDLGLHIWVAGYLERIGDPLIKQLLRRRAGFALGSKESLHDLNVRASHLPNTPMPRGRAWFAQQNMIDALQIAWVNHPLLAVRRINEQIWNDSRRARWLSVGEEVEATDEAVDEAADEAVNGNQPINLEIDTTGLIEDLLGGGDE